MLSKLPLPSGLTIAQPLKKIGMAGGTFAVAMGIGFFMQQGDATASLATVTVPVATADAAIVAVFAAREPAEVAPVLNAPVAEAVFVAPSLDAAPVVTLAALETDTAPIAPVLEPVAETPTSCDPVLAATVQAAAMVTLSLVAPCDDNARVTIHHEGMMFTVVTDETGRATVEAPALSETAVFIAAFASGEGALVEIAVPSLAFYDRVVLQWQGATGLQVHALEFGSTYGEEGHVWADEHREASVAATGVGGFLVRLGEADTQSPLVAEVYTFPTGMISRAGNVTLSVEAEVSPLNCNRDVAAQTLQIRPEVGLKIADLTLAIPDCDTIGDFLVLKNLFQDLTLAAG